MSNIELYNDLIKRLEKMYKRGFIVYWEYLEKLENAKIIYNITE